MHCEDADVQQRLKGGAHQISQKISEKVNEQIRKYNEHMANLESSDNLLSTKSVKGVLDSCVLWATVLIHVFCIIRRIASLVSRGI